MIEFIIGFILGILVSVISAVLILIPIADKINIISKGYFIVTDLECKSEHDWKVKKGFLTK